MRGIAVCNDTDLHQFQVSQPSPPPRLATHSFHWDDAVFSLLSAERVLALPGVPTVNETRLGVDAKVAARTEPVLLFGCGAFGLGIEAGAVQATAPQAELLDTPMRTALCVGIIDHFGVEVPVLDTLQVLGLGQATPRTHSSVLVIRYPDSKLLGLLLDAVLDIPRVAADRILAMPSLAVRDDRLFRGVYQGEDGQKFLVLDVEGLRSHADMAQFAALSRATTPPAADGSKGTKGKGDLLDGRQPYLVFRAGAEIASPLVDISEIVALPRDAVPLTRHDSHTIGLFTHRGRTIPLVSLSASLGKQTVLDPNTARVLLVSVGAETVGLVVESLGSIENAQKRPTRADASGAHQRAHSMIGEHMAEFGHPDGKRLVPHLCLADFVRQRTLRDGRI